MEYISLFDLIEYEQCNVKSQYIHLLSYLTSTYDLTLEEFNKKIQAIIIIYKIEYFYIFLKT